MIIFACYKQEEYVSAQMVKNISKQNKRLKIDNSKCICNNTLELLTIYMCWLKCYLLHNTQSAISNVKIIKILTL